MTVICKEKKVEKHCSRGSGHIQFWIKVMALVWRSSMCWSTQHHFRAVYEKVNVHSYENVFNINLLATDFFFFSNFSTPVFKM